MRPNALTRCLAAVALIGVYCLSIIGISGLVMTASATSAQARGRGGGRGFGGRGFARGRGRGIGPYYYGGYYGNYYDSCWWSRRYQRWVCPYPYYR